MVLFSADLSIIQDSIIKVGDKISRDFVELENLQNSYKGSTKFAELIKYSLPFSSARTSNFESADNAIQLKLQGKSFIIN